MTVTRPRLTLRNCIIGSTMLGVFASGFMFNLGPIHLLYFYPLLICNLLLLTYMGQLWFPPGLIALFAVVIASGLFGIAQGTVSVAWYARSFWGIFASAIFFCAFFRLVRFDVERIFHWFAKCAVWDLILGIVFFPLQDHIRNSRIHGFSAESGEFSLLLVPVFYYFADRWQRNGEHRLVTCVLLAGILITDSSMGYMGVFFAMLLFVPRYRLGWLVTPVLIAVAGVALYGFSTNFQRRVDDTFLGATNSADAIFNPSSFHLLSGAYVAQRSFEVHPILGNGIGSVKQTNMLYVHDMPGIEIAESQGLAEIASGDGGSLLFRLIVETGLAGILACVFFMWKCYPRGQSRDRREIAKAILIFFFIKFLRSGIYFSAEVFFLVVLYGVNGSTAFLHAREAARLPAPSPLPTPSEAPGFSTPPLPA